MFQVLGDIDSVLGENSRYKQGIRVSMILALLDEGGHWDKTGAHRIRGSLGQTDPEAMRRGPEIAWMEL